MEQQDAKKLSLPYTVFLLFSILVFIVGMIKSWQSWAIASVVFGIISCVGIHLLKAVDMVTKRLVFSVVVWNTMTVCIIQDVNDIMILGMMIAFIVLLSQFDIVGLHYISIAAIVVMYTINVFQSWGMGLELKVMIPTLALSYFPVLLVEFTEFKQLKDRIQRNEQMQLTMKELRSAEQSKMDFMANVSHELGTPLNVICGISSALQIEPLPDKIQEDIHQIHIAGRQLVAMVSDILDFTELENDTIDIINEPYNIISVINDVISMAKIWSADKNLDIILDFDARIPNSLVGDSQKLYRIMLNLVNNAVKFTSEGGVTIIVRARKEPYGVNLAIDIKDTGIGIREQDLEKLYSVYNQVDTKRDRKKGGVGLGLAISRKMVTKMNGFMHITSVYGEGTKVSVVIPQKCTSYDPVVSIEQRSKISILYYVDLNKYKNGNIRDDYVSCIEHIAEGLQLENQRCHSIQELQRRLQNGKYNYVFTSIVEYLSHKEYLDSIKDRACVVVVVNSQKEISQIGQGIRIIPKPFHVFGVAEILNDRNPVTTGNMISTGRAFFYAPDAKVLAVDDVRMNLNVLNALLQRYKIAIDMAESGKEALEKIRRNHYDLIFMDHMMPEMDGVDTLHNIRRLPVSYSQSVPVVALTANAIGGARETLINEGFDDFIAKPIELSALERVLYKYLSHCIITPEQYEADAVQAEKPDSPIRHTTPKTVELVNAADEPAADESAGDIYSKLKALSCLSAEIGLLYCGNDLHSYVEILNDFVHSGKKRLIQLDSELQKEDFDAYRITVHSLKGMAATIGGVEVAELSKSMQQECEAENYDAVRQNHTRLTRLLGELIQSLEETLGTQEEQKLCDHIPDTQEAESAPLGEADTGTLMAQISQAVHMFDQMQALDLIEQLENDSFDNPALRQLAEELRSCMDQFDFMEAERILAEKGGV